MIVKIRLKKKVSEKAEKAIRHFLMVLGLRFSDSAKFRKVFQGLESPELSDTDKQEVCSLVREKFFAALEADNLLMVVEEFAEEEVETLKESLEVDIPAKVETSSEEDLAWYYFTETVEIVHQ